MVRGSSGAIVAATVAMLEQQQLTQSAANASGLRRVGAVPVLPHHTAAAASSPHDDHHSDASSTEASSDTSSDGDQDVNKSPIRVVNNLHQKNEGNDESSLDEESTVKQNTNSNWTDSAHDEASLSSDEGTSASDTEDNAHEGTSDQNTTGCDDDFQWIQNCDKHLEELEISTATMTTTTTPASTPATIINACDISNSNTKSFNDLYMNNTKDPGKPVVYRNKTSSGSLDRQKKSNRKERDNKSKSSATPYQRYHSPSRQQIEEILRYNNEYRNFCYNCSSSSCQDLPDFRGIQRRPDYRDMHRYGSSPGLNCHWSPQQPVGGCRDMYYHYPPHRNISPPYCPCDQMYHYKYYAKSTSEDEHIRRLESDKESLSLQVTVLNEQIDAQTEKISDLEKTLDEKKKQLSTAEDVLQREMLTRSSLETQKLELLAIVSELKRQHAALERENCELRDRLSEERRRNKPPMAPRVSPFPMSSTPTNNQAGSRGVSPSPSPVPASAISPRRITEHQDDIGIQPQQTPLPPYRRAGDQQYSSLPRQMMNSSSGDTPRKGVAFAESETIVINDSMSETDGGSYNFQQSPSLQTNKSRGIKKIFGRMKRSGSGNLDDLPGNGEFRRGGLRATAGGRLGWSSSHNHLRSDVPFSEWNTDALCDWLIDMGLESCVTEAKRWVKSGAQLLSASTHEIEKELGLKNPLHKKKLHLALHCYRGLPGDSYLIPAGYLDTTWVLRWLDDAGLPQHKDAFLAARVDGRLLHRLTVDDLATLHVTSVLHVASIRTGIQVLRSQNFEPNCLIRRSNPDETSTPGAQEVALWTNHRVMEWLRVVDLAEYAPNLRGSGVHGGLLVYEPRFTGELLASLLSIPPGKTLLRRHLTTHFKELLGREVIQEKREAEASLGYVPLTATAKMKVPKKSQFTLKRKKSKSELDYGELVCPLSQSRAEDQSGECHSVTSPPKTTQNHVAASHENSFPSQNNQQCRTRSERSSDV